MNKALLNKFELERIKSSRDIFEGIVEILKDKKRYMINQAFSEGNYEMEAWSQYQADKLGAIRTLSELITLFEVNKDD